MKLRKMTKKELRTIEKCVRHATELTDRALGKKGPYGWKDEELAEWNKHFHKSVDKLVIKLGLRVPIKKITLANL